MEITKIKSWLIGLSFILASPQLVVAEEVQTIYPFKQIQGFLVSPLQQPTQIMSSFGQIRSGYIHEGIDVRAEIGTPLFAVMDGIVTKAAPDSKGINAGGGHMVFINHGEGTESRYMHLESYAIKTGDKVKAGDLIGFSGMSGDSTAPLLHYEYRINNIPVDPTFIFEINGMLTDTYIPFTSTLLSTMLQDKDSFLAKQS
ncbi:hypothetical protein CS063_15660 [Sporanaerobium hydrogeniformans]|uniref:Uncharacterized protein n=1 Tax=Sporanaerobium hydrogeniformans TaxID=3072179 RepID=A0AC61D7M3_9FIRM|nr:M23 family metallopeptidase [Sporanaerobium hydrogeniformans]PHV69434.1 hypothetical protein CS063_15660 [Sporanaerobium hydrogeniformans]